MAKRYRILLEVEWSGKKESLEEALEHDLRESRIFHPDVDDVLWVKKVKKWNRKEDIEKWLGKGKNKNHGS